MHFHAEHALFFEERQPLWVAAASLAVTSGVLVLNSAVQDVRLSSVGTAVGATLLLIEQARGRRRVAPALVWLVTLAAIATVVGLSGASDRALVLRTGTRVSCGVLWVLWLGTRIDWASLRQLLLRIRVPQGAVASLDHAIMHGILTQREWVQRRDAARSRLGSARLPLAAWGPLLGEGAFRAFERLEHAEQNALVRSASCSAEALDEGVRLDAVDVERGGHPVLEGLELRLAPGEWVLVCGPSGAGKSSLLRLLAGLDAPASGTLSRLGRRIGPDASLRERLDGRVALLGQNPEHHFVASTVAEDVAWGLLRRGVDPGEAQRRTREVTEALRIDHLLHRPCHQLSFGEQRRAALAGLLVLEPALLLLDEPTAGLDPVAAHELRQLVQASVRESGAACVWATHDVRTLPPPVTRVVLLRGRRVVFDGPADEGLSTPWRVRAGLEVEDGPSTAP